MPRRYFEVALILVVVLHRVFGSFELGLGDDQDLASFVTVCKNREIALPEANDMYRSAT